MTQKLKLNLGCGQNAMEGYLNVDKYGDPDLRFDLETFPWPWADNSVEEIVLNHVLEHLGESTEIYLKIIQELYRICCANAIIKIAVPHPRHDNFLIDPTHVRAITAEGLGMFSKKNNQSWKENNDANTPLGFYLDVDFEVTSLNYMLDEPWRTQLLEQKLTEEQVFLALRQFNNIAHEIRMEVMVIKQQE